jgi:ATP-dependent 26S proteasome regulatory subunit
LEETLTSRPGRIDQAIEFPLPDEDGRRKLILLYSGGMKLDGELLSLLVMKSKGGSGAFIKELMRRSAQFLIESGQPDLTVDHVEAALDELLFSGGKLNAQLLGFSQKNQTA